MYFKSAITSNTTNPKLINDTIKHCKNNNVKKLHIVLMGDLIHGTIHVSARLHQNEVVTNQVLIASEMMTTLIATLSQIVGEVEIYNANGNHGRVSANVKESISEENFETFIYEYVKLKTEIIKLKEDICNNVNFFCFYEFVSFKCCNIVTILTCQET